MDRKGSLLIQIKFDHGGGKRLAVIVGRRPQKNLVSECMLFKSAESLVRQPHGAHVRRRGG